MREKAPYDMHPIREGYLGFWKVKSSKIFEEKFAQTKFYLLETSKEY